MSIKCVRVAEIVHAAHEEIDIVKNRTAVGRMDDRIGMNQASRLHVDDQSLEHETGRGDNEHNEMMAMIKRLRHEHLFLGISATQANENHNDVKGPVLVP